MNLEEVQAVVETTRQLARIVKVDKVIPHPNADKMSLALIGGWQCCIKLNEFKDGDLALYVEIDSLVPTSHPTFTFLEDRTSDLKTVNEKTYCRIKTIKLRKELSQGILLQIPPEFAKTATEGMDVTEPLGVLKKAEKAVKAETNINEHTLLGKIARFISGPARTNLRPWPSFLDKSDQIRVQNMGGRYPSMVQEDLEWERTIKLNGQSVTMFATSTQAGVCSRNNEISTLDDVWSFTTQIRYWLGQLLVTNRRMFRKRQWVYPEKTEETSVLSWIKEFRDKNQHNKLFIIPRWKKGIFTKDDHVVKYALESGDLRTIMEYAAKENCGISVQGELVGPGIQSNFELLPELRFFVYKIVLIECNGLPVPIELLPFGRLQMCVELGLAHIPILDPKAKLPPTIGELLKSVEGYKYFGNRGQREGEVWKCTTDTRSMKVISNKYLIQEAETEG